MAKHYLVFIHGIGERDPNQSSEQPANTSYLRLWKNLEAKAKKVIAGKFSDQFAPVYTDWHTPTINQAQSDLFELAFPELVNRSLSITRALRSFTTFFMGDVVAYVSEDVNFIRRTVWQQMWQQLGDRLQDPDATYSIIAHSLGSVIAFDYVYSLFEQNQVFIPKPDPARRPEDSELEPVHCPDAAETKLLQDRFRHFFTFGSPIGLFLLRKGSLWMDGQPFKQALNPVSGRQRVWLNFYDREDLIAYPLGNLFSLNPQNAANCLPRDIPINTGFTSYDAHVNYWQHPDMAEKIAAVLTSDYYSDRR